MVSFCGKAHTDILGFDSREGVSETVPVPHSKKATGEVDLPRILAPCQSSQGHGLPRSMLEASHSGIESTGRD